MAPTFFRLPTSAFRLRSMGGWARMIRDGVNHNHRQQHRQAKGVRQAEHKAANGQHDEVARVTIPSPADVAGQGP